MVRLGAIHLIKMELNHGVVKRRVRTVCGILPKSESKIFIESHEIIVMFYIRNGKLKGIEEYVFTKNHRNELDYFFVFSLPLYIPR